MNLLENHAQLYDDFTERVETWQTDGRAVVALRFDRGLNVFAESILPRLRERGFVSTLSVNSRGWSDPENLSVSPEAVDSWSDVEIANHSATGGPAPSRTALRDEIAGGLRELKHQLPKHLIWGWIPPSAATGEYTGFDGGQSEKSYIGTFAGDLILSNHAWALGTAPGALHQIGSGFPHIGVRSFSLDASRSFPLKPTLDKLANQTGGMSMVVRPNLIGKANRINLDQLSQSLDEIKERVDRGELRVVTISELMTCRE